MAEFTTFDGIRLAYIDRGDGPVVVLLHGFLCSAEIDFGRRGLIDRFAEAGRRVIAMDARGHGDSDKPHEPAAYGARAMARDVEALIDHLGATRVDVVGYSLGAFTALEVALRDPRIRGLCLGGIGGATLDVERLRAEAAGLEAETAPQGSWFWEAAELLGADRHACAAWLRGARLPQVAVSSFPSVVGPVWIVNGADDQLDPHEFASRFPVGRGITVPGAHDVALDADEYAALVCAWMKEIADG
jgi:pimeloyl-ACP methyl ester carboxylesterase